LVRYQVDILLAPSKTMEKDTLVFAVHLVVALGLATFGAYRISLGAPVTGGLNVVMAAVVVAVGRYVSRLA